MVDSSAVGAGPRHVRPARQVQEVAHLSWRRAIERRGAIARGAAAETRQLRCPAGGQRRPRGRVRAETDAAARRTERTRAERARAERRRGPTAPKFEGIDGRLIDGAARLSDGLRLIDGEGIGRAMPPEKPPPGRAMPPPEKPPPPIRAPPPPPPRPPRAQASVAVHVQATTVIHAASINLAFMVSFVVRSSWFVAWRH
jgi:hypothetical protein